MSAPQIRTLPVRTHGRYLVRTPDVSGPWPLLVGFHGYRESAAAHLDILEGIPGTETWLLAAPQGLHRFYTKGGDVVASWMTKEDRELAIADNVAYVTQVLDAVRAEFPTRGIALLGFSQGVAMAFRAAARYPVDALIVAGADVPPDVLAGPAVPLPPVLYGRGSRDELYSAELHAKDVEALRRLGALVTTSSFEAAHELAPDFLVEAVRFIETSFQGSSGSRDPARA